jgi:hypothetical protein
MSASSAGKVENASGAAIVGDIDGIAHELGYILVGRKHVCLVKPADRL